MTEGTDVVQHKAEYFQSIEVEHSLAFGKSIVNDRSDPIIRTGHHL